MKPPRHSFPAANVIFLLVLSLWLGARTVAAQTEPDSTVTRDLADLSCRELQTVFYADVPRHVYADDPDALYELVLHAADRCDLGEPLGRITILASIWDGSFSEAIYGYEVIGWLVDRYDPDRRDASQDSRALFDQFTTDFADQLLPHTESGSLEEFFCLYYSGRQSAAWELLRSEAVSDTWLRYYYDEETDRLRDKSAPLGVTGHWGWWDPRGDQSLVGGRQLAGVTVEQRGPRWFFRVVLESRTGRSDQAYFVNANGIRGYSDRWNALLVAAEGGHTVWRHGRHLADLFVGVGLDAVTPFKGEKIARTGLNLSFGAGYRFQWRAGGKWFTAVDGRYEWVSERNGGGTPLGGTAFSARVGVGLRLGSDPKPRLRALGAGT